MDLEGSREEVKNPYLAAVSNFSFKAILHLCIETQGICYFLKDMILGVKDLGLKDLGLKDFRVNVGFRVYEVIPQSKLRQIGDIFGPIFGRLDWLVAASGCLKDLGLKDLGLKDFRVKGF